MVEKLGIDGLHVGDAGATVLNPISKQVIRADHLPKAPLRTILKELDRASIYVNVFTADAYYISKKNVSGFTDLYSAVADRSPVSVDDISALADKDVLKVNIDALADKDVSVIEDILKKNASLEIHIGPWSLHPALGAARIKVLTKEGVSKYSGLRHLVDNLNLNLDEVLGIGDTVHDWEFIEHCGYRGIMANATDELKGKADFTDPKTFLGGHVDEDGVITIFKHFKLI
jgi:hydroxymethylpyrimidine pyrophosphatase-like HAD family hydrolase